MVDRLLGAPSRTRVVPRRDRGAAARNGDLRSRTRLPVSPPASAGPARSRRRPRRCTGWRWRSPDERQADASPHRGSGAPATLRRPSSRGRPIGENRRGVRCNPGGPTRGRRRLVLNQLKQAVPVARPGKSGRAAAAGISRPDGRPGCEQRPHRARLAVRNCKKERSPGRVDPVPRLRVPVHVLAEPAFHRDRVAGEKSPESDRSGRTEWRRTDRSVLPGSAGRYSRVSRRMPSPAGVPQYLSSRSAGLAPWARSTRDGLQVPLKCRGVKCGVAVGVVDRGTVIVADVNRRAGPQECLDGAPEPRSLARMIRLSQRAPGPQPVRRSSARIRRRSTSRPRATAAGSRIPAPASMSACAISRRPASAAWSSGVRPARSSISLSAPRPRRPPSGRAGSSRWRDAAGCDAGWCRPSGDSSSSPERGVTISRIASVDPMATAVKIVWRAPCRKVLRNLGVIGVFETGRPAEDGELVQVAVADRVGAMLDQLLHHGEVAAFRGEMERRGIDPLRPADWGRPPAREEGRSRPRSSS